jgi:hypothetical protein
MSRTRNDHKLLLVASEIRESPAVHLDDGLIIASYDQQRGSPNRGESVSCEIWSAATRNDGGNHIRQFGGRHVRRRSSSFLSHWR